MKLIGYLLCLTWAAFCSAQWSSWPILGASPFPSYPFFGPPSLYDSFGGGYGLMGRQGWITGLIDIAENAIKCLGGMASMVAQGLLVGVKRADYQRVCSRRDPRAVEDFVERNKAPSQTAPVETLKTIVGQPEVIDIGEKLAKDPNYVIPEGTIRVIQGRQFGFGIPPPVPPTPFASPYGLVGAPYVGQSHFVQPYYASPLHYGPIGYSPYPPPGSFGRASNVGGVQGRQGWLSGLIDIAENAIKCIGGMASMVAQGLLVGVKRADYQRVCSRRDPRAVEDFVERNSAVPKQKAIENLQTLAVKPSISVDDQLQALQAAGVIKIVQQ